MARLVADPFEAVRVEGRRPASGEVVRHERRELGRHAIVAGRLARRTGQTGVRVRGTDLAQLAIGDPCRRHWPEA